MRLFLFAFVWLVLRQASFSQDGQLDTSFDGDGIVTTVIGSGANQDYAYAVTIDSDQKILVAGTSYSNPVYSFAVVRYNTDGSLDTSFGSDGIVTTTFGTNENYAYSLVLQNDGKIVVAGHSNPGSTTDFAVVRLNADGSLDTSFDGDGKVITDIVSGEEDIANAVAISPDGKIIVAGYSYNGTNENDFSVVRYNSDGSLDTSFDGDGKVTTTISTGDDVARAVAIDSDGKILVAGESNPGSGSEFVLVRYNSDGSLDSSFDSDGIVTTLIGVSGNGASSVAFDTSGRIVVAGTAFLTDQDIAVVRYNADGSLDGTFDTDGIVTTDVGSGHNQGLGHVIQADGKIVVSGFSQAGNIAVVRYNADGSLDNSFGSGGIVTTENGASYDVAIQGDGKIVAVGNSPSGFANNFAVVRYWAPPPQVHYGGGEAGNGNYYFANSTASASEAPSQPVYEWIVEETDSVNINSPTGGDNDDGFWEVSLPFSFPYFGNLYSTAYIGTNGYVSFGGGYTDYTNLVIPNADSNVQNMIAFCWLDMYAIDGTTTIYYGGDASRFVITYDQLTTLDDETQYITAQVILFADGRIRIQYNDTLSSAVRDVYENSSTVGIENEDGTLGITYWGPMFSSDLAVMFGQDVNALPAELVSFSAIAKQNAIELNWKTATEVNNHGFEVQRRRVQSSQTWNTEPGTWNVIGFVGGSGTSSSPKEYSFVDKQITPGRYAYRIKQIDYSGSFSYSYAAEVEIGLAPREFRLAQNYPNPFNPATTIEFTLPEDGKVSLKVFDVLGREVAVLLDEERTAGVLHRIRFDASHLAGGTYFYRVLAGNLVQTRKLILTK